MLQKSVLFLILIFPLSINSQNLQEILNISVDKPNGTARFESMGGAFGALGGDLSAIHVNPASSSVFNDNEYGLTLGTEKKSNKSLFFNNSIKINNNKFSVNQGGGVWLLKNFGGGNINKISFGINAQTNNSFSNSFEAVGRNTSSIDKFFLNNSLGFNSS
ncbi:MAG: transporter, partial [Flavobacteriaceae bacterium]|nr:transporter [Flavobacteriaceae bacterium]